MHHTHLNDFLSDALQKRKQEGLLRQLTVNEDLVDFCSNDYLGFAQNTYSKNGFDTELNAFGSTGSRLVSGNSLLAEETEQMVADFHHAEAALIFSSGYMANVGLCSSIADKNSTFIYDEQIHASIIDGMRLSLASRYKFRHNDTDDLKKKLSVANGRKFVVVESLYSMDGDLAPLVEIADICAEQNAALIVDEAHATGVYGNGKGLVCQYHIEQLVWARIYTFGKALGLHGAAVAGSSLLHDFLINHARSFIYTTALPPYLYCHLQRAYILLPQANRSKLFHLIDYFKESVKAISLPGVPFMVNPSPIQSIMVPGNDKAVSLAWYLKKHGFFVKAILSPTVAAGTERIRICLHSFNTTHQIDDLLSAVKMFFQ
jgi:8-amino-7-oxononanoate synthase